MRRCWNLCFLIASVISSIAFNSIAQASRNPNFQFITEPSAVAGKWLVTISVGLGISRNETVLLRDTVTPVFTSIRGGGYQHAIDINDYDNKSDNDKPTRANVERKIEALAAEIASFKADHPDAPTMVAITLTGHGTAKDGTYEFRLLDDALDGAGIVDMVEELGARETIVIMQSCQSGGLVNKFFKSASLTELGHAVEGEAIRREVRVAVVTPANDTTNSPLTAWERNIIAPSLTDAADADHDGIITWHEWKNFLRRRACESVDYAPGFAGLATGVDPQLFETGMGRDVPLFLTEDGAARWQIGALDLPSPGSPEEGFSAETNAACASSDSFMRAVLNAANTDVVTMLRSLPQDRLQQAFTMMLSSFRSYKPTDDVRDFVTHEFPEASTDLRVAMLNYVGCDYSRENASPSVARLVTLLRDNFDSLNEKVQLLALFVFSSANAKSTIPLLERVVTEAHPQNISNQARWILNWLKDQP